MVRMFSYGCMAIVLGLHLEQVGLNQDQIGVLLSWTLLGDAAVSLPIGYLADRLGRRRMLLVGAGLVVFAGVVFALASNITLLTIAAIIGLIGPSGNAGGPVLSVEQASRPQAAT